MRTEVSGGVLVLPGGKPESSAPSSAVQLANLRMEWFAGALRRRLGDGVRVRRVQYRVRGWNDPQRDALRDAEESLTAMREQCAAGEIVAVGHSMGGRVAAHLAATGDVGAVVALAPWWPRDDGDLIPVGCRLLVLHGTADTWTDPRASQQQTVRAAERGVDAQWIPVPGAGHYLLKNWARWHRLTAEFAAAQLSGG